MAGAVEMGAEDDPFVADLPEGGQAEDLEAAGVGKDGAVPVHETVQAAQLGDGFHPGSQVEMIDIAQDEAGPQGPQFLGGEGLHRAVGAHRQEDRGLHRAVGRGYFSTPRPVWT